MSLPQREPKRRIVFVGPNLVGECLRGARAVQRLDRVELLGVCQQPPDSGDVEFFTNVSCIDDVYDASQLTTAVNRLTEMYGSLERIVTVHETLLTPVAQAGQTLGLPGMELSTVRRVLDKSLLKGVLQQAGIETAGDQVITSEQEARSFVDAVGLPIVLKPLGGSGGLVTWQIRTDEQLETALDLLKPSPQNAVFIEEHLCGQELCIDTITIANEPQFHSICCYQPTILHALEDQRIQWTCVMPRDITGERYRDFIDRGLAAVRALQVGNAVTHMEGFLLDGGGVSFTDATLRPAGARIGPMLAFAYDIDPYFAWARVAVDGAFDGPWERKYAVGTIFLRGTGRGHVTGLEGIAAVKHQLGDAIVDSRLPGIGNPKSVTYTGDGYVTVRHPETPAVEQALDFIAATVRISYTDQESSVASSSALREHWSERLQYFTQQLFKPTWDDDSLSRVSEER